jgi:glycosyltransferase involved in cell wall biosynthesis
MAAGRPVIVTAAAGIARFVRESQSGAIVPVGSPEALAAAMVPFLREPECPSPRREFSSASS